MCFHKSCSQQLHVVSADVVLVNEKNRPYNFVEDQDDNCTYDNFNCNAVGAYKPHNKVVRKRVPYTKRKATHKVLQIPSVNKLEQGSRESPRIVATKEESLILKNE